MNFADHLKNNWLITFFAAIFFAAIVTMIFLNDPHQTIVVFACFVAAAILIFGAIIGGWYLASNRRTKPQTA